MQNIESKKSENTVLSEVILISTVLIFMAIFYYGFRALTITIVSVLTCYLTDIICCKINKKQIKFNDLSSIGTGAVLALMMPASVPYKIIIFTGCFSIIVAKHIFGGKGKNIFVPAAVGYIFSAFSFKDTVLMYPKPGESLPIFGDITATLSQSLTKTLDIASVPSTSQVDIVLGKFLGPMGATHFFILIIIALVFIFRKNISPAVFFSALLVITFFALFFPVMGNSMYTSLLFELSSGMTLFGLLFISCDYYTVPKKVTSRFLYGFIIGLLTVMIKRFGSVENAIIFATVIANPLRFPLDDRTFSVRQGIKEKITKLKSLKNKDKEKANGESTVTNEKEI